MAENASARIGFFSFQAGVPGGAGSNTIQNNGGDGVTVWKSANVIILGNIIKGNSRDGVRVARGSQADISSNIIEANGGDGINVSGTLQLTWARIPEVPLMRDPIRLRLVKKTLARE